MSDLKGYSQMQARLKAIGKTEVLVRTIIIHGVGYAQHLAPHKTGNLRRTIRPGRITPTTGELVAGGQRQVGYAGVVERGSRPHIIRPKTQRAAVFGPFLPGMKGRHRGGVLAWGGPRTLGGRLRAGGKATNFATVVHHPGTKAHPYLVPGLKQSVNEQGTKAVVALWDGAA